MEAITITPVRDRVLPKLYTSTSTFQSTIPSILLHPVHQVRAVKALVSPARDITMTITPASPAREITMIITPASPANRVDMDRASLVKAVMDPANPVRDTMMTTVHPTMITRTASQARVPAEMITSGLVMTMCIRASRERARMEMIMPLVSRERVLMMMSP